VISLLLLLSLFRTTLASTEALPLRGPGAKKRASPPFPVRVFPFPSLLPGARYAVPPSLNPGAFSAPALVGEFIFEQKRDSELVDFVFPSRATSFPRHYYLFFFFCSVVRSMPSFLFTASSVFGPSSARAQPPFFRWLNLFHGLFLFSQDGSQKRHSHRHPSRRNFLFQDRGNLFFPPICDQVPHPFQGYVTFPPPAICWLSP